ncbi:NAD-dependent epimerase [Robertkochia flava]|uniref:NAD-dependent epimerase n=1 Tax=Robertkochia flava TaxID=3447986 RepID=UPI001CCD5B16|nr:NAD-dependent epimerase [Robertkochia marina]
MKRILVTGAAGFIGFHLSKKLIQLGYEVVGLDNINDYYDVDLKYGRLNELGIGRDSAGTWNTISTSDSHENFRFIRMNLEDREAFPELFNAEKFDVVVNLAAQAGVRYSLENPESYIDSNLVGFLNILECCRHHDIEHLLYASSSSVYGENKKVPFSEEDRVDHPVSLYAATKRSNELMAHTYCHLYGMKATGLRFFTVYGPWGRPDMAPMLFASAILKGEAIKVFNEGNMRRDFTFIDDIIQGMVLLLENKKKADVNYSIINIGKGSPESLSEFIALIEKSLGIKAEKNLMPMQPGDVPQTWADTSALQSQGYSGITKLEEGIPVFVKWYLEWNKEQGKRLSSHISNGSDVNDESDVSRDRLYGRSDR